MHISPRPIRPARNRLFDLDGTLLRGESFDKLLSQHVGKIYAYIVQNLGLALTEAQKLSDGYYHTYGSTLEGLMINHKTDPEDYYQYTFDNLDYTLVQRDEPLCQAFNALRKKDATVTNYIFTNSTAGYAEKVLDCLGIRPHFADIFTQPRVHYISKTKPESFQKVCGAIQAKPDETWLFEDAEANARAAQKAGLTAVFIQHGASAHSKGEGLDYVTSDIAVFLNETLG